MENSTAVGSAPWRTLRRAQNRGFRPAIGSPVLRALAALAVIVGSLAIPVGTLGPAPAEAVELPPLGVTELSLQTSGPNAGLGIGDWYTTPIADGGGDQDHLIEITIPELWPGLPVTIALFDPEVELPDPAGVVDEVRNANDTSTFTVFDPSGSLVATQSYAAGGGTNGQWTELVTISAPTAGVYQLTTSTSDDDDNSWRVRVNHDPDCAAGCSPAELDDGDEIDDPDGIPGTGDELVLGIQRASFQHAGAGSVCRDAYFFVDGSTSTIDLHNFDMDNNGSVTYFPPDGSSVSGTISANQEWNNSAGPVRVGDTVSVGSARIGWWRTEVCIPGNNQYIFEGVEGESVFLHEPPPAPELTLSKENGVTNVAVGDTVSYELSFTNTSDASTSPGAAESVVLVDTLPDGLS
ncbi:MAG: hypothetical protein HKN24_05655, partial [Acidimicrobiales bacterium]|nr:hypothetical protein [Acidimicrobiales bacterium]